MSLKDLKYFFLVIELHVCLFFRDCELCPPGKFCSPAGRDKPSGECSGGWYCLRGAWSQRPVHFGSCLPNTTSCFCPNTTTGGECQPGEYCPSGSSQPIPCKKGTADFHGYPFY